MQQNFTNNYNNEIPPHLHNENELSFMQEESLYKFIYKKKQRNKLGSRYRPTTKPWFRTRDPDFSLVSSQQMAAPSRQSNSSSEIAVKSQFSRQPSQLSQQSGGLGISAAQDRRSASQFCTAGNLRATPLLHDKANLTLFILFCLHLS